MNTWHVSAPELKHWRLPHPTEERKITNIQKRLDPFLGHIFYVINCRLEKTMMLSRSIWEQMWATHEHSSCRGVPRLRPQAVPSSAHGAVQMPGVNGIRFKFPSGSSRTKLPTDFIAPNDIVVDKPGKLMRNPLKCHVISRASNCGYWTIGPPYTEGWGWP